MKGLASFVMSGRYRALLVAMASSGSLLFCWLGAAVTALVTLRRGPAQGAWILMWASLPALVVTRMSGDTTPLALLAGTFVLALVLRLSVSLALAVLASALVGVITGLLTLAFGGAMLEQLSAVFADFVRALQQANNADGVTLVAPGVTQLAGMIGAANAALSVLCLMLARYWQAALYNPGGFAGEFRELRYPVGVMASLVVGALALASMGLVYRSWSVNLLIPVSVIGFALLHAWAAVKGRGTFWLTAMYVAWLLFDAAKLMLVGLAVVDAWVDFRRRWLGADRDDRDDDTSGRDD
ncbi:hypothetical protein [Chromatocurvus halotolerans]|uniref:Uncharacterized protein n=1 Tax=Chromatocurvus halotolerans TaxID=1132028 RepID=A0A4R2L691_9GAMM|nr:hypothetical protein [Chromatocurvus halotolerans]TCO74725.1 hypothetical protein EV688_11285 [Chromatocurvus halotolerans]